MKRYGLGVSLACLTAGLAPAMAQDSGPAEQTAGVGDIIVTAQKRAQSINSIGMSITAATGDSLQQRGVSDPADLVKVVPGFTFAPTSYGPPVYTLRGIGLYEAGLISPPAVSIYVDEMPLAFPVMAQGGSLDLDRVEVLKGPQGTLFGQNSTGGAINYIAAKPTADFDMGGSLTYARFSQVTAEGHVSGPITDNIRARVAMKTVQGGAWQRSVSRPGENLGDDNKFMGRLLLDIDATDTLKLALNLNGFVDRSDTQAPQLRAVAPGNPNAPVAPVLESFEPFGRGNPRVAEWSVSWPNKKNDRFWQAALRADQQLGETVTLTSLSSYQHMKVNTFMAASGLPISNLDFRQHGFIKSFNQEVRLAGDGDRLNWMVGGSFEHVKADDRVDYRIDELSVSASPVPGVIDPLTLVQGYVKQKVKTYAVFGNAEFRLTDQLTLQAGARYTDSKRTGEQCTRDIGPSNGGGQIFEFMQAMLKGTFQPDGTPNMDGPVEPIGAGQCYSLDANLNPVVNGFPVRLHEDNLSWRAGVNYKADSGALLYASYSRGWKAGTFTQISASSTSQFIPARQERVDAFEAGFKLPLADRRVQFNSAAFYYNYKDKQIRGRMLDPVFTLLEALVNVPKSRIWGVEAELVAQPVEGLNIGLSGLYLNTKVNDTFVNYNQAGVQTDFQGSKLPYSPKWSSVADAQYEFPVSAAHKAFLGGTVTYHGRDRATFETAASPAPQYKLRAYALVDLRAGIGAQDDSWRLSLFGRNIFNKYYETSLFQGTDTLYAFTGRPATYGVTLTVKPR
ncbi:MAG: TonB-dependent receptor [Sphingobium sp.]